MATDRSRRVSSVWRWISFGLGALLLSSWAFLGYSVLDGAISLDYCRVEQQHQRRTIRLLIDAGIGRLSSGALLEAIAKDQPALADLRLEEDNTLPFGGVTLQFDEDGILVGSLGPPEARALATP